MQNTRKPSKRQPFLEFEPRSDVVCISIGGNSTPPPLELAPLRPGVIRVAVEIPVGLGRRQERALIQQLRDRFGAAGLRARFRGIRETHA